MCASYSRKRTESAGRKEPAGVSVFYRRRSVFWNMAGGCTECDPAINYRLYYTDQDVGGKEQFARIGGVILEGGRRKKICSRVG